MKPIMKFAAAAAMAFSIGMLPQANAEITLKSNGVGDALLFPVFNGYVDNYFTISNSSNQWVQAHIRYRNASWSGELLDFDVIFSPGDVLIFRIADLNGDGKWEIDQSLDPKTFEYSGMLKSCEGVETPCIAPSELLIPPASAAVPEAEIMHAKMAGYIEVISEGYLNGMTHAKMARLTAPAFAGQRAAEGQREVDNKLGTSIWSWVDGQNATESSVGSGKYAGYHSTRTAEDAGNWLSGTAFITVPNTGMGIAYNAEAFVNFRTTSTMTSERIDITPIGGNPIRHRIDNYPNDWAVIVHNEDSIGAAGGISPQGDYIYGFRPERPDEDRTDEARISFNNTWGPTLADGDDYNVSATWAVDPFDPEIDNWDNELCPIAAIQVGFHLCANSIAEVEDAIRAGGQVYTSFFFDEGEYDNTKLESWYFTLFPTKFYQGEHPNYWLVQPATLSNYISKSVAWLLALGKPISLEIWDHEEHPGSGSTPDCPISPCLPDDVAVAALGQELALFNVDWIKSFFTAGAVDTYTKGRVVVAPGQNALDPKINGFGVVKANPTWPFLGYTFELDPAIPALGHWRSMQR